MSEVSIEDSFVISSRGGGKAKKYNTEEEKKAAQKLRKQERDAERKAAEIADPSLKTKRLAEAKVKKEKKALEKEAYYMLHPEERDDKTTIPKVKVPIDQRGCVFHIIDHNRSDNTKCFKCATKLTPEDKRLRFDVSIKENRAYDPKYPGSILVACNCKLEELDKIERLDQYKKWYVEKYRPWFDRVVLKKVVAKPAVTATAPAPKPKVSITEAVKAWDVCATDDTYEPSDEEPEMSDPEIEEN